jgi:hypothetical protein
MLNVITFRGIKNREKFVAFSDELRKKQIFHKAKLFDNSSSIWYNDNVRGLDKLKEED